MSRFPKIISCGAFPITIICVACFIMVGTSLYGRKTISGEEARLIFCFSLFALSSVIFSVIYMEHDLSALQQTFENETALRVKEKECEIYKTQIEDQREIRSLYHDMKNHILILENCRAKDYKDYLLEMEKRLEKHHNPYQTGNQYLDILLREKGKICEREGIRLDINVNFKDVQILEPTEVCIV